MSIWLARRQAAMKFLYKTNFELYLQLCKQLKIRCIRFAIPDSRCRSKQSNTLAVDGDRCRFLIRQKIWWSRHRPATIRDPGTRKLVIYTRHPVEQPPWNWGVAAARRGSDFRAQAARPISISACVRRCLPAASPEGAQARAQSALALRGVFRAPGRLLPHRQPHGRGLGPHPRPNAFLRP
eukprot:GHVT01035021.1.p1 GENE.GHVT01035021.1~~GHVT01035021.1.p1  ORF type:complete len:181 (+),score=32.08 GHVT01035021.1:628-1170(+)